jgi:acetyl esterase/lipase
VRKLLFAGLLLSIYANAADREPARVERNLVYGMYSGAALLLDVHRPAKSNGRGLIFISGSGWQAGLDYAAVPLKEQQVGIWGPPLTAAGYTVFALNHRAAPRFHHPAALEDVQRAIRFVRFNAKNYGIDPARLGGVAGSSGGHLVALAATLAAPGIRSDTDPVNRESATLQAIVLRAAPVDLANIGTLEGIAFVTSYMEAPPSQPSAALAYAAASPLLQLSTKTPPMLLIHGDADKIVPFAQSTAMLAALEAAGVPARLVLIPGGEHGIDFGSPKPRAGWPDYLREAVSWLDRYLETPAQ